MRLRLSGEQLVPELADFLRFRGFLTVDRGGGELEVHLLNHVSDRHDRKAARAALAGWHELHPDTVVQEVS